MLTIDKKVRNLKFCVYLMLVSDLESYNLCTWYAEISKSCNIFVVK